MYLFGNVRVAKRDRAGESRRRTNIRDVRNRDKQEEITLVSCRACHAMLSGRFTRNLSVVSRVVKETPAHPLVIVVIV